jgi:hypothetical protein
MVIVIADQTGQWIVRLAGDESSSDVSWGCRLLSEWLSDKSEIRQVSRFISKTVKQMFYLVRNLPNRGTALLKCFEHGVHILGMFQGIINVKSVGNNLGDELIFKQNRIGNWQAHHHSTRDSRTHRIT